MRREDAVRILKAHEAELRGRGVVRLALFGSLARGAAGPRSDVDVVVEIEPGRKFSLIDLASLRVFLRDVLHRETDVVIHDDLRPAFREEVEREAIRVL